VIGHHSGRGAFLDMIFGSHAHAAVMTILFGVTAEEFNLSEIASRAGMPAQEIDDQLRKLTATKLLYARTGRGQVYYRANAENPGYRALRDIVLKTSGLCGAVAEVLAGSNVAIAFVFGSVVCAEARDDSDVDLVVCGEATLRQLASRMAGLSVRLGREVNPHFFSHKDVGRRLAENDHFFRTILASKKIFVVGNEATLSVFVAAAHARNWGKRRVRRAPPQSRRQIFQPSLQ
jgi:predicted nucleotidyltransferase